MRGCWVMSCLPVLSFKVWRINVSAAEAKSLFYSLAVSTLAFLSPNLSLSIYLNHRNFLWQSHMHKHMKTLHPSHLGPIIQRPCIRGREVCLTGLWSYFFCLPCKTWPARPPSAQSASVPSSRFASPSHRMCSIFKQPISFNKLSLRFLTHLSVLLLKRL